MELLTAFLDSAASRTHSSISELYVISLLLTGCLRVEPKVSSSVEIFLEFGSSKIRISSFEGPHIPIDRGFHVIGDVNSYAGTISTNALSASCNSARASEAPKQW